MFGLTESQFNRYKNLVKDFAQGEIFDDITANSLTLTPMVKKKGDTKFTIDQQFFIYLHDDVRMSVLGTFIDMSYTYADMRSEKEEPLEDKEIYEQLHYKYIDSLFNEFVQCGLSTTSETLKELVGTMIIEIPFLYEASARDLEEVSEEDLPDEEAYNYYMEYILYPPEDSEEENVEDYITETGEVKPEIVFYMDSEDENDSDSDDEDNEIIFEMDLDVNVDAETMDELEEIVLSEYEQVQEDRKKRELERIQKEKNELLKDSKKEDKNKDSDDEEDDKDNKEDE